jgi:hypothetical protein
MPDSIAHDLAQLFNPCNHSNESNSIVCPDCYRSQVEGLLDQILLLRPEARVNVSFVREIFRVQLEKRVNDSRKMV